MKQFMAVVSTLLQFDYVLNLLAAITQWFKIWQISALYGADDPQMMASAISESFIGLLIGAAVGLIGVFLAWLVLRDKDARPLWFVRLSGFFAWAWMVFLPIGTVVGALMLRWRKSGPQEQPDAGAIA